MIVVIAETKHSLNKNGYTLHVSPEKIIGLESEILFLLFMQVLIFLNSPALLS